MYSNAEECFDTGVSEIWQDFLGTVKVENVECKLYNNNILVEVENYVNDEMKLKQIMLKVDNTFSPYKYIVRTGVVTGLPYKLESWKENPDSGLMWETENQLREGDRIWFYGSAMMGGEKLICGDKKYVLINYQDIFVAKRNEEVIPVNGNVIMEIIDKTESALAYKKEVVDTDWAIIKYVGKTNKSYESEFQQDSEELKEGMTVCITGIPMRKLELAPYLTFGDKEYLVCQNHEINGYLL